MESDVNIHNLIGLDLCQRNSEHLCSEDVPSDATLLWTRNMSQYRHTMTYLSSWHLTCALICYLSKTLCIEATSTNISEIYIFFFYFLSWLLQFWHQQSSNHLLCCSLDSFVSLLTVLVNYYKLTVKTNHL